MSHPIPDEALDDRLSFVGTAGSGKTYNSGGAVERILSRGGRVIIPDPLGVWWGLRLNSTGSAASPYSVVIFGGPHGDLPITEQSGAVIGETVAGMAESAIIDLSALGTKAGERRFMLAFLTALYARASGEPVHLILDEADLWAPQRILDREADAAKLLGQMETIVRRGRVKGFIPWLITQRPAVVSKDVLSQMDGIIAFKLTGPHDRAALGSWIEGQADKGEAKVIDAALPTLQRGEGIVWVPGRKVLTTSTFPPKATFDSSRTPKRGEVATATALKPIDLGKLKDRLAGIVAETKANDPKALKARIAELERNAKPNANFAPLDPKAIAAAEEKGRSAGFADGYAQGKAAGVKEIARTFAPIRKWLDEIDGTVARLPTAVPQVAERRPAAAVVQHPAVAIGADAPSRAHQKILDAVAWWNLFGIARPSQAQVAFVAGYSHKSGTWATYLSRLRSVGLIDGRGEIVLTPARKRLAFPGEITMNAPVAAAIAPGIYFSMPEDEYHAAPALGSTNHRQLLRSGPDFWWNSWLNPARPVEEEETHAKIVGSAMHACLLDGRQAFLAQYAATFHKGNVKAGIKEVKAIREAGKIPLKFPDYQRILAADALIKANPSIASAFENGRHEVSIFWHDDAGIPCKARIDYLKPRALIDLKSIRNMRETEFVDACRRRICDYRYDIQAAHYMEARAMMPKLPVHGFAGDAAWLDRVMTAHEWAFTIIFFQADDAPISWGCTLSPKNPILEVARNSISAARWRYTEGLRIFGTTNAWVLSEPLAELDINELPSWFGKK